MCQELCVISFNSIESVKVIIWRFFKYKFAAFLKFASFFKNDINMILTRLAWQKEFELRGCLHETGLAARVNCLRESAV